MRESQARRAFVLVIDACGAGALPDAAAYGDQGTNTLAQPGGGDGRADTAGASAPRPGLDPRAAWRAAGLDAGDPRPPRAARPRQGLDHRSLGADGSHARAAAAHVSRRVSARAPLTIDRGDGARGDLQPPGQRPERDRGLRRRAPAGRGADPLYHPRIPSCSSPRTSSGCLSKSSTPHVRGHGGC